jgi:uncharacterized protein (DUF1684 family)
MRIIWRSFFKLTNASAFVVWLLIVAGCSNKIDKSEEVNEEYLNYVSTIESWKDYRVEGLKKNWLSLAGLFPLKEGENRFGAADSNDIVFPGADIPLHIGTIFVKDGEVSVKIDLDIVVLYNDEKVIKMKLLKDSEGEPTVLQLGSLSWYIIQRVDRIYVRLKDSENPLIKEFKGIKIYPVDTSWRVKGQFEPHLTTKTIETTTNSGDRSLLSSTGAIGFGIGGQYFRLDAWPIGDSGNLQTLFADETSGDETYGGGRFLIIEKSGKEGSYTVDFNKAYNPPCVFTEFATCPLPPPQNRLPIKITAGEKHQGSIH